MEECAVSVISTGEKGQLLDLQLTIKNFRCFEDADPVHLELRSGATAFLGSNNSGKSSLLRMFFELRGLLGSAADNGAWVQAWLRGQEVDYGLSGVPDPQAILNDRNSRPMRLRLDCPRPSDPRAICSVEFVFRRERPQRVSAILYRGPDREEVKLGGSVSLVGNFRYAAADGELDFSHFATHTRPLRNTLYIGPFRNILNQSKASYYDLNVGTDFVATWDTWKNGHNRANNRAIKDVERAIGQLFGFDSLEINPATNNEELRVFVNGQPFALHEQGAGLTQFIVTFGVAATRSPSVILIDEPELNLHPSLQVEFLTTLATFASEGVVFATHSIGLARSVADSIYSLRRHRAGTSFRTYETTPNLQEFAGELSFSAYREFGYERLLLVEGPTDVRTVQQLLRKLKKDHKVVVFPLLGHAFASGAFEDALVELRRVAPTEKMAALVDSERTTRGGPADPKRQAFADACKREGFANILITERRAIENYFSRNAVRAVFGDQYDALGPYDVHGKSPCNWNRRLNWKIAHAMDVDDLSGTELLAFLEGL